MSGMTAKEALRWVKRGFVIEWTGEEFVVVNFLLNPTRVKQRWTKDARKPGFVAALSAITLPFFRPWHCPETTEPTECGQRAISA